MLCGSRARWMESVGVEEEWVNEECIPSSWAGAGFFLYWNGMDVRGNGWTSRRRGAGGVMGTHWWFQGRSRIEVPYPEQGGVSRRCGRLPDWVGGVLAHLHTCTCMEAQLRGRAGSISLRSACCQCKLLEFDLGETLNSERAHSPTNIVHVTHDPLFPLRIPIYGMRWASWRTIWQSKQVSSLWCQYPNSRTSKRLAPCAMMLFKRGDQQARGRAMRG